MTVEITPRVVFIGASGEMCRIAVKGLAKALPKINITLADIRPEIIAEFAASLGERVTVLKLDLFDAPALANVVRGASLVILGAGPYMRTSGPVVEACLEAKVPYLDFDDDVESTEHALSLDAKAKAAGIPVFIGCGASPGITNVMTVDAANDLDEVHRIDVTWLVGHEKSVGKAVLEHLLHIAAGDCVTWEGGRRVTHDSMVATDYFPILPNTPDMLLYETAHPEPVTLPRKYPNADRIRCYGGLDPMCQCGLARGIGLAVKAGTLTQKEAVQWVFDVANGNSIGSWAGWKAAFSGMLAQINRGESTYGEMIKYLVYSTFRKHLPYRGGLLAQVYGTKNGKPAVSARRCTMTPPNFGDMGGVTGLGCAAFAILALESGHKFAGTFAPEDWAEPARLYDALTRVGVKAGIVEAL